MWRNSFVALVLCLASAAAQANPDSVRATDDAYTAPHARLQQIELDLHSAQEQFDVAQQSLHQCQQDQRREKARMDQDPNYCPGSSLIQFLDQHATIRSKSAALQRIGKLLEQKREVSQFLPLREQLRLVEQDLQTAERRSTADPNSTTQLHVMTLKHVRSQLREAIGQLRP